MDAPPLHAVHQNDCDSGWGYPEYNSGKGYMMLLEKKATNLISKENFPSQVEVAKDPALRNVRNLASNEDFPKQVEFANDASLKDFQKPKKTAKFFKTNVFDKSLHEAKSHLNRYRYLDEGERDARRSPCQFADRTCAGEGEEKRFPCGPNICCNTRGEGDSDFDKVIKSFKAVVKRENEDLKVRQNEKSVGQPIKILTKIESKTLGAFEQESQNGWKLISFAVDSGACATVANPDDIPNYPITETPASKAKEHFTGAGGEEIPNLGG